MQEADFVQKVIENTTRIISKKGVFEDIVKEISGGKMFRPRTIYTVAYAMGVSDFDIFVPLASSTELVHLASLFHDDVIDNGLIRRDKPTLRARYGNLISILAGDYFYSIASQLVLENYDYEVAKVYSYAASHMTLMELRQASLRWNTDISEEDYFNIIRGKTGALFSAAFEAIGIILKRTDTERLHLREAGMRFGEIFQLTDDLLDFVGRETGKSRFKDLSEGDITLPAILLMKKESQFRELCKQYFDSKGKSTEILSKIDAFIERENSLSEDIKDIINKLKQEAHLHLRLVQGFSWERFATLLDTVSIRKR